MGMEEGDEVTRCGADSLLAKCTFVLAVKSGEIDAGLDTNGLYNKRLKTIKEQARGPYGPYLVAQ